VSVLDDHPLAWVTAGTHRNLYSIEATVTQGQSQPDPTLNTTGGVLMGAAGTACGTCLGLGSLGSPAVIPIIAAIVCCIISGVVFLIGFLLWLLSLFLRDTPPPTESAQSTAPGSDVARDGGPAGVPSGFAGTITSNGVNPSATVAMDLRVINRFRFQPPDTTNYPPPNQNAVENPSWWAFPGRWGVRIKNSAAGSWDSGTRRTDQFERSRGYWNAYQLVAFLQDPERAQDGISA
jgi:hypothetical protein